MTKNKTTQMALIALFAALTGVFSQISIPLPFTPVPINLAMLSVFVAGGMLGWKNATISQGIYILIGAIGIPVFSKFGSGLGVLVGPTGGYIIGYLFASLIIGIMIEKLPNNLWMLMFSMIAGLLACYLIGTVWFMIVTKNNFISALTMCVFPFLIGDALKIFIASIVIKRLRKAKI